MSRARTVAEGWVPIQHGIPSSYNRGCRCDECRARHAERVRGNVAAHYERNVARRVLVDGRWFAPDRDGLHGRRDTYIRFGCRCEPCTDANAEYERRRAGAA